MAAAHTPGPWATDEHSFYIRPVNVDSDGERIAVAIAVAAGKSQKEVAANAALIKAAPDLLAALKSIMAHEDALSASSAGLAVIGHASTAIAAATGAA